MSQVEEFSDFGPHNQCCDEEIAGRLLGNLFKMYVIPPKQLAVNPSFHGELPSTPRLRIAVRNSARTGIPVHPSSGIPATNETLQRLAVLKQAIAPAAGYVMVFSVQGEVKGATCRPLNLP